MMTFGWQKCWKKIDRITFILQELKQRIEEEATSPNNKDIDMFALAILSHGSVYSC